MLQKGSGSWDLTDQLVSLCGTSRDALIKGCPKEIAVDSDEGKLLWVTALALVLLICKFLDQKDELEMIAEKGTKWMKKNLPAVVKYENVLTAAATTVSVKIYWPEMKTVIRVVVLHQTSVDHSQFLSQPSTGL